MVKTALLSIFIIFELFASVSYAEPAFTAKLSGAINSNIYGTGLVRRVESGAILTLQASDDIILISIPAKLNPGTYPLSSWEGDFQSGKSKPFGAIYVPPPRRGLDATAKSQSVIRGELVMTKIGPADGTFNLEIDLGSAGIVKLDGTYSSLEFPMNDPSNKHSTAPTTSSGASQEIRTPPGP